MALQLSDIFHLNIHLSSAWEGHPISRDPSAPFPLYYFFLYFSE